jgi:hypothetical protein
MHAKSYTPMPLFDRAVELYQRCADIRLAEDNDVAVMIDVLKAMPRERQNELAIEIE